MVRTNKALICGFYGNYNLGDEAMLAGMINLLRKQVDDLSLTVLSNDPKDTENRHSVKSIHINNQRQFFQRQLEILRNKYFILGGGDLLRDSINGSVAKFWLAYLEKALQLRHRTFVLGVSVGEIWRPETKKLIPKLLNQVDIISVRDIQSKIKLERLGVSNDIHVASDLALEAIPKELAQLTVSKHKVIRIGISIAYLSNRGLSANVNQYFVCQKTMAEVADFLVEKYEAEIHLLPFRTYQDRYHSTDDDYVSILAMLRYSKHSEQMNVHRYVNSLDDLYQLVSSLDLMIGMRLHSLIIAAGLNVPVIAAEYAPKVRGFMEEIERANFSIPLQFFTKNNLLPLIESILNNLLAERQRIAASVQQYQGKMTTFQKALTQIL